MLKARIQLQRHKQVMQKDNKHKHKQLIHTRKANSQQLLAWQVMLRVTQHLRLVLAVIQKVMEL